MGADRTKGGRGQVLTDVASLVGADDVEANGVTRVLSCAQGDDALWLGKAVVNFPDGGGRARISPQVE